VRRAVAGIEADVWVVDNNSVDGSVRLVKEKFPEVKLIANKDNVGFSRANNQAIRESNGEYVLLLNPDTVVEDDTFSKILAFMDEHPDAGGLGVKMIDGKGNFLPESKRGLPTPNVAFYKIFGLSSFFPRSRTFGKYHLGYLDKDEVHEVEILSGAFMFMRRAALDKTGLLDEEFFMYGEDIDLSYRIIKAGYKNYYFPETRIIHYKGESTKKSSVNYVFVFYRAMVIFARKHFSQKNARMFSLLINMAIWLRASLAILNRFLKKAFLPFLDIALIFTGIFFIKEYWENKVIFPEGGNYPIEFIAYTVPAYILVWLFSVYLSGGYDRPIRLIKIFQGIALGTVFILVVYALLSESYRFSRAIIILGAVWGFSSMILLRLILHLSGIKRYRIGTTSKNRRFIIVGQKDEAERVSELLHKTWLTPVFVGLVSIKNHTEKGEQFIGTIDQLSEIIPIYGISEVIFCSKNLPHQVIIDKMSELQHLRIDFKIAPEDSLSIIGSNSINTSGDLYTVDINSITSPRNKRNKRFLDILSSLGLLILLPVNLFIVRKPAGLVRNILQVLFGQRSWVGYNTDVKEELDKLPQIKPGILHPEDAIKNKQLSPDLTGKLNLIYARDYDFPKDLNIIFRAYRELGRKCK
jgi:GT2 family glycosyltransferase/lipopolysaccharide/colanic/teichoic acid biosynthesis glycosyltransferase